MSREKVLALLKQSEGYLSGAEMSRRLGISRAAVWKAIDALRQEGYQIDSATNRGYCLRVSPDRLSEGEIRPYLTGGLIGRELRVFETVDSTNSYLKREAALLPDGTAAVAGCQTGGRGRLGRSFRSEAGEGVYLSVLLRPPAAPEEAVNLTAYVAVAVCDGLEAATGVRPQIKWTNDIILGGRKVCGILTEMGIEGESGALQYLVTGIGVNVRQRAEDWPEELRPIAGSLYQATGKTVARGRLAACLLNALDGMYARWLAGDRAPFLERYRADCLTVGRAVRILRGGTEQRGVALGVDGRFGLRVRLEDGTEQTVTSGEVSVRGLEGYL